MNLNPEVDVRGGGGGGRMQHTKSWPQFRFFTKIRIHILLTFSELSKVVSHKNLFEFYF